MSLQSGRDGCALEAATNGTIPCCMAALHRACVYLDVICMLVAGQGQGTVRKAYTIDYYPCTLQLAQPSCQGLRRADIQHGR